MKGLICTLAGLFASMLAMSEPVRAVMLDPTTEVDELQTGDFVSFDLLFDVETPILGGGFDVVFDELSLALVGFDRNGEIGDPAFSRDPDVSPGLLESWAIGDFFGLSGQLFLGSVDFRILETMGETTTLSLRTTQGIAGPFISAIDFSVFEPDYNAIELTRAAEGPVQVPEPGTLGLSAIALIILAARRRADRRCAVIH